VLRTAEPTIGNLLLDLVSLDYSHTLMAAAGHAVESAKEAAMKANFGQYLLVVTGSIPTKDGGIYVVGGRTCQDILEEAARARPRSSPSGLCPPGQCSGGAAQSDRGSRAFGTSSRISP
jgi:hydrogenase small subunit